MKLEARICNIKAEGDDDVGFADVVIEGYEGSGQFRIVGTIKDDKLTIYSTGETYKDGQYINLELEIINPTEEVFTRYHG